MNGKTNPLQLGKQFFWLLLLLLLLTLASHSYLSAQTPEHWAGATSVTDGHSHDHELVESTADAAVPLSGIPCIAGFAGPYPCHNVDLLAFLPTNALVGSTGADIWGWTDPETGREYAVSSHSNAVSFVDLSTPTEPVFLGYLPAPVPNVLWRDVKVYNNHAYIVGDGDFVQPHGVQIFDLTQLRNAGSVPTEFSETARYLGVGQAHNIAINEETGVAYVVGSNTCSGGLHMLDVKPAADPVFLGCYSEDGYTHDTQCVIYRGPDVDYQGREICFNSNTDTLTIVDVTDKNAPVMLSRTSYDGFSYTHQGWLTEDHAYFALGDELDEMDNLHNTHTYLWDMGDLDAPVHFSTYVGPTTAIDHNLYFNGQFLYESNYTSGLRILDASDIANGNLTEIAYFDTHPADNATTFAGTWSNYPFFESGVVIVSNIEDGLYILQPHLPEPVEGGAMGAGWLADTDGRKINFNFQANNGDAGVEGRLRLNDKAAGIRIDIAQITGITGVAEPCGGVPAGPNALQFRGSGSFNDTAGATFRVCVADNGQPGRGQDLFYLECESGCDYDTGSRTADNIIDGGNIQRHGPTEESSDGLSVLGLEPTLLTDAVAGTPLVLSATAYGADGFPLADVELTLIWQAADGTTGTLTAITDLAGVSTFAITALAGETEYTVSSGDLSSNALSITGITTSSP